MDKVYDTLEKLYNEGSSMYDEKYQDLLQAVLAADSYCLGTHWVYDAEELENLDIDWEVLNAPHVAWHEGKGKGDLTHYGDQICILEQFLREKDTFNVGDYMSYWRNEMNTFKGYMDGATKDTMVNLDQNLNVPCGSNSGDMSVIGRIVPLLTVSHSREEFLQNTALLAKSTHNNPTVLDAMDFFATLLLEVLEGTDIRAAILMLKPQYSQEIQTYIESGIASKDMDTPAAIAHFGSACPTEFSFPGTIHLLFKYNDYKTALIQNAMSGGDSAARGMVIASLYVAQKSIEVVPEEWLRFKGTI